MGWTTWLRSLARHGSILSWLLDELFPFVLFYLFSHKHTYYYYYYVQSITILASKHHLICLFNSNKK